jgi:glycosyltransferase involved in cell wall biosynthesis
MVSTISVVIPAYNAAAHLPRCLQAIRSSTQAPLEVLVVDDGSKDETEPIALSYGATVLSTEGRTGPAFSRNLGAKAAAGDVLFFLDSDVCVHPETLYKVSQSFDSDPQLDALMGSYDHAPASQDFISQYRNLMHAYVHHTGAERASTFWSGCGAIRRSVFLEHSGFDEGYKRPAIEDIELGYRLIRAGRKIVLDPTILVTHLKQWTFWSLVKTDILDRGIPWTELILRDRFMPDDLNLQLSQRVSVALVFILVALSAILAALSGAYLLIPLLAILFLMLTSWWAEFGSYRRPRRAITILICMIVSIAIVAYTYRIYGLIPPLVATPVLLLLRHRYSRSAKQSRSYRGVEIFFIYCSIAVAAWYLPAQHLLVFACFAVVMLLGLLNSQFYIFLAGKRGMLFMLAAIPFHLLYHFYNGLSFIAGAGRHYWSGASRTQPRQSFPSDHKV